MQKKLHFRKINKILTFLSALVLPICSIIMINAFVSCDKKVCDDGNIVSESMYEQLKSYNVQPDDEVIEMNNLIYKNSKSKDHDTDTITKIVEKVEEILVLDCESGSVLTMPLEEYVILSLVAEMPQSFEMQALMAQAVAIRTFVVRSVFLGSKHKNAHVCSDYRCCQGMMPAEKIDFDISKCNQAVKGTEGIVAVYNGEPIVAAYHSSSFNATKSSEEVWGSEVDYLVSVYSPEGKGVASKTTTIDAHNLRSSLKKIGVEGYPYFTFDGNGICTGVTDGEMTATPKAIRRLFGLRSESFFVEESNDVYSFTCYGYGHGVGMSQYGANELAKNGYDFYEILKHYYSGISFAFV